MIEQVWTTSIDAVPERRVSRPDGVEIAYWVIGEGTPLLLITGLGTPAASWGPFPQVLADQGYKVIIVDNRDCGNSSSCEGIGYTIADMANDAVAALNDLGIDKTYLLGISMGGMIAQEVILNHPERITRLMLLATTPGAPAHVSADGAFLTEVFTPSPNEDTKAWTNRTLGMLMGPGFADGNPEIMSRMADIRVARGSDPAQFSRQWQAIMGFGAWDRLTEVEAPTLVVHGIDDPLVPYPNGEKIASRIPGAELVSLPGVGHFVPLEAPAETLQAIVGFLPVKAPVST